MNPIFHILKKYFLSRTFEESGFIYQFVSVLERDNSIIKGDVGFIVDVKLPNPGQSYCTEKFNDDILNFISNFQKYLGESFSYSLNILVDGEGDVPDLYITPEKQYQLIEKFNEVKRFSMGNYTFKAKWYRPKNWFYEMNYENVNIHLYYDLFDVMKNSKKIEIVNKDVFKETVQEISDLMYENDELRNNFETICYEVLDTEIKLASVEDSYYEVTYRLGKLEGIKN